MNGQGKKRTTNLLDFLVCKAMLQRGATSLSYNLQIGSTTPDNHQMPVPFKDHHWNQATKTSPH
eukprot:5409317-Karenia_brevis.AAC.1